MSDSTMHDVFDLAAALPSGMTILEASAGTGKTYALTALVARYLAESPDITAENILMVTFTRAAAAEMRDRTRQRLFEALRHLEGTEVSSASWISEIAACDHDERQARITRLRAAVSSIDAATITTIHGFCQQALREMGVAGGDIAVGTVGEESGDMVKAVLRDRLLARLAVDPDWLAPTATSDGSATPAKVDELTPKQIESNLAKSIKAAMRNAGSVLAPVGDSEAGAAQRWAAFAQSIIDEVRATRVLRGELSFDDLITGMEDAAAVQSVVERMRRRYRVVLIDEFQDTDAAQWNVFRNLFVDGDSGPRPAVVCVGDPKQAIYRFRGADIDAYLAAVDHPAATTYQMSTNWRTDRVLVEATNTLLHNLDLGKGRIRYRQVNAADDHDTSALSGAGTPLQFRWLADDGDGFTVDRVRPAIAADLAQHVANLLASARLGHGSETRPVRPGDISVLVRGHDDSDYIVDALRAHGIPAVKSKVGSVTSTEAMVQLQILADALTNSSDGGAVRALALTWFVNVPLESVMQQQVVEELQTRCATWNAALRDGGAVGLLIALRTDHDVLSALARADLERRLTDIEHILELVHSESRGATLNPAQFRNVLASLADDGDESEMRLRRTDTDADAVQISTMHSAKGLEYPIVLLPFAKTKNLESPVVYGFDRGDGTIERRVDGAPPLKWTSGDDTPAVRSELAAREIGDDERRLIYVALTRAKHQLVIWWASTKGIEKSATAPVLFRDGDGNVAVPKNNAGVEQHLTDLAARLGPAASVIGIGMGTASASAPLEHTTTTPELQVAAWGRAGLNRSHWYRWSFSSMMKSDFDAVHDIHRGGLDESDDETGAAASGSEFTGHLVDLPSGADFGTLVHEVLERVDTSHPDLASHLGELIERDGRARSLGAGRSALRDGLLDLLHTPLHGLFGDRTLASIPPSDRLNEMEFHFAIRDAAGPLLRRDIAAVAALDADGPFASYFQRLATSWTSERVGGLMTGSIDALLRADGRYTVVDYKSNRLHPSGAAATDEHYTGPNLLAAMETHDYPMQALLYSVALHRFLGSRLPGYDPETHHGGAGYLFVRGMTGATTPVIDGRTRGLCAWRPSTDVLVQLDALFASTEVAA